jgi:hypothetical protein
MTTRKPKPSLLSTIGATEERLHLITVTVKPNAAKVCPNTWQVGQSPSAEPVASKGQRRLH